MRSWIGCRSSFGSPVRMANVCSHWSVFRFYQGFQRPAVPKGSRPGTAIPYLSMMGIYLTQVTTTCSVCGVKRGRVSSTDSENRDPVFRAIAAP